MGGRRVEVLAGVGVVQAVHGHAGGRRGTPAGRGVRLRLDPEGRLPGPRAVARSDDRDASRAHVDVAAVGDGVVGSLPQRAVAGQRDRRLRRERLAGVGLGRDAHGSVEQGGLLDAEGSTRSTGIASLALDGYESCVVARNQIVLVARDDVIDMLLQHGTVVGTYRNRGSDLGSRIRWRIVDRYHQR